MVELDGGLEAARQEIHRLRTRGDEEEERWRAREQELLLRLEDGRAKERKLEDQRHNLEVCLADATQQIQELKVPSHTFDSLLVSMLILYTTAHYSLRLHRLSLTIVGLLLILSFFKKNYNKIYINVLK